MYRIFTLSLITTFTVLAACGGRPNEQASNTTQTSPPAITASKTPAATPDSTPEETAGRSATLECQNVKAGDHKVYKKQTFAIDFEPFKDSCFVSTYDPEYG